MQNRNMEKLTYEVTISAPALRVWRVLTEPETYKQWVKAFSPDSYFDGEWKQGASVKFLDPNMGGTKAILDVLLPEKRIRARHVSLISKEGEESTSGEMADKWIGTTEDYSLTEDEKVTTLSVVIETHSDFVDMFDSSWPEALETNQSTV